MKTDTTNKTIKVSDNISYDIVNTNVVQMIICTSIPEDDKESLRSIQEHIRETDPAGTTNNWTLLDEKGEFELSNIPKDQINGNPQPCVPCSESAGKFHYVLLC